VASTVALIGHGSFGMERYIRWQNSLLAPPDLARSRFVEIPALHQTGLYRTATLRDALGGYRDLPSWPIDQDLWLRWFQAGLKCGKLPDPPLYLWRQHEKQSTRTHGRCSLENMRGSKVHFLLREGGPAHGRAIVLYSVKKTLRAWQADLEAAGATVLHAFDWHPKGALPALPADKVVAGAPRPVRLFCYGSVGVRDYVAGLVGDDWDAGLDWMAA